MWKVEIISLWTDIYWDLLIFESSLTYTDYFIPESIYSELKNMEFTFFGNYKFWIYKSVIYIDLKNITRYSNLLGYN